MNAVLEIPVLAPRSIVHAPRVATGGRIAGSGPVDGFVLDAEEVWRCFE